MSAAEKPARTSREYEHAEEAAAVYAGTSRRNRRSRWCSGSGLGAFADELSEAVRVDYRDIPHFPQSTVAGHSGRLVVGYVDGVPVAAMQGRVHLYEGYSAREVAFPMRVLGRLGVKAVVLTNASGGIIRVTKPDRWSC